MFKFDTGRNLHLDTRDTYLNLKLQIFKVKLFGAFKNEKTEQKAKPEDDLDEERQTYSSFVNNLLHSLFSNCEVYLNNTIVYNANG